MTFYIYNLTDLIYNETKDITGTENSTVFNYTLLNETAYNWNCEASNNYVEKTSNFTIIYDITSPLIENLTNTPSYNLATIVFDTGEAVNYSLNYSGENVNSSGYSLNPSVSITGLTALISYMYNLTICDQAGNCNSTNSSFTTTAAPVVSSGGGGSSRSSSGGSSSVEGSLANPVSFEKIRSDGYTHTYGVKTSKYFKDASNNTHNITLDNLIQGIAVITIQTDPITTYLLSNQSYKINLTSADYYDTEIKTGEVSLLLAEITVVAINETIPKPVVYHTTDNETAVAQNNATISFEKIIEYKYFSYIIGLVFIFTLIVLLSKLLKRKKTIEEYDKKQDTKVKTKRKR
jgi:hypothetical protein